VAGYIRSHIKFQLNILIVTFNVKIRSHCFWICELHKVVIMKSLWYIHR